MFEGGFTEIILIFGIIVSPAPADRIANRPILTRATSLSALIVGSSSAGRPMK